jgi:hypothetical protein
MKRIEDKIQFECCQWLRSNKITFFHVPNGGLRSKAEASRLTALGVVPGVPDLVILLPNNKTLFVELKKQDGVVSKLQSLFHEKLITMGFPLLVLRTDRPQTAVDLLSQFVAGHTP